MIERTRDEVVYYHYDSHPTEEDLMGETALHAALIRYLVEVLTWLFHEQVCAVHENLNFYHTGARYEHPLVPDIAVIKAVPFAFVTSWHVGTTGPAPQVVFEIASEETWGRDLDIKPGEYAALGVQEYYAYDPYEPPLPLSRQRGQRLFGWHRDRATGMMRALPLRADTRLWSPHLESLLVPSGQYLRLYDRSGHLRLTEAEAEGERADEAVHRAEEAIRRAEALAEKLRALGIDPDQAS